MALDNDSQTCFSEVVTKGKSRKFLMLIKSQDVVDMKVYKRGAVETYRSKLKKELKGKSISGGTYYHGVISGKKKNLNFQLARADGFDKAPLNSKKLRTFVRGATDSPIQFEPIFEIVDTPQLSIDPDDSPVAAEFLDLQEDAFNACDNFPDAANAIGALCLEIGKLLDKGNDEAAGTKLGKLKLLLERVIAGEYVAEKGGSGSTESSSEPELSEEDRFAIDFAKITEKAQDCIRKKIGDATRINEKLKEIQDTVATGNDYPKALLLIKTLEKELICATNFHELTVKYNKVKKKLNDTSSKRITKDYLDIKSNVGDLMNQSNYPAAESRITFFDQVLNDTELKAEFEAEFKKVFEEAKKKLSGDTVDATRIRSMLESIFTIGAKEGNCAKAFPLLKELEEELKDGPIVTGFKKLTKRIEKLSNFNVSLKENLNQQCTQINQLLSEEEQTAVDSIQQLKQHLDEIESDPNFIAFEESAKKVEKLGNPSKELKENLHKQCTEIGELLNKKDSRAGDKIKQLKQHLDDITDKKKAREFKMSFKVAYEIAKVKLRENSGDTGKIRMLLDYVVREGVNNKHYTEALLAIKRLEEAMGDAPVASEFIELKNTADRFSGMYPKLKGKIGERYQEISDLINDDEYKKAGAKINQFKQYISDITDTKKEKKYTAAFQIVSSMATEYIKKDSTKASVIDPIINECNELAEYRDFTAALLAIKRLEEVMGNTPVAGEFIELKDTVDKLSGKYPKLKGKIDERYQEISDLMDRKEYRKAEAKIKQFNQYISDITDAKKEKKYEAIFNIVFSMSAEYIKRDPTKATVIDPIVEECEELAAYRDFTAALLAIKRLEEVMGNTPVVGEFIELKDEADRLVGLYPKLKARLGKKCKEISDSIDKGEFRKVGAKIKELQKYLNEITDTKKEKEYTVTFKIVSAMATECITNDHSEESQIKPKLDQCIELATDYRDYIQAIPLLKTLQEELEIRLIDKDAVVTLIDECIDNARALNKKSSIGLITSVIDNSERIIAKFSKLSDTKVQNSQIHAQIEELKEELASAAKLRDRQTKKRSNTVVKDIKKVLFNDKETEAFEAFMNVFADESSLIDLYNEFGGRNGLTAVKQIYEGLCDKKADKLIELMQTLS